MDTPLAKSDLTIINLELVRGCGNCRCPSYGKNCSTATPKYMTGDTFREVLSEVQNSLDLMGSTVCFNMYGHGEGVFHPAFSEFGEELRRIFHRSVDVHLAISSDIHAVQLRNKRKEYLGLDTLLVSYKRDGCPGDLGDLSWLEAIRDVRHHVIAGVVDDEVIDILERIANAVPRRQRECIYLLPDHGLKFEFRDEGIRDKRKMEFRGSAAERLSLTHQELDNLLTADRRVVVDRRAYFDVDGRLRNCLLLNSRHQNLREHLLGESRCQTCRSVEVSLKVNFAQTRGVG